MSEHGTITFTAKHVELFCRLSRDFSPLHVDERYASRTPFGRCVIHGVLGGLVALGRSAGAEPARLTRLVLRFARPMFLDVAYRIEVHVASPTRRTVKLVHGGSPKLLLEVDVEVAPRPAAPEVSELEFAPRLVANDVQFEDASSWSTTGGYRIDPGELQQARQHPELGLDRVAPLDIAVLCWASYLVGMEVPGRQALFHSLRVERAGEDTSSTSGFVYDARVAQLDRASAMLHLEARLRDRDRVIAEAQLQALIRPGPVDVDLEELTAVLPQSSALVGSVCLVTGASRGLGALLALGCARHGADVVVGYRRNRAEAERVRDMITGVLGRRCVLAEGDVGQAGTWERLAALVRTELGQVDVLINNAYPPIQPLDLDELTGPSLTPHLVEPITAALLAHQAMVRLVRARRGCIVNVSSAYVAAPPRTLLHYAMAKGAIEALARGLASAYPEVRFVTVRPPRLLTDQTRSTFDPNLPPSPVTVVAAVLAAIEDRDRVGHTLVDRFS